MIPLRPTFNSVFANWNEQHKNVFGSYLNTATASKEDVDRQAKELEETTLRLQQEWDSLYGDTPEGKIIKENPPPEWMDVYSAWSNLYKEQFGSELLDRPWNADADAKAQKEALDQAYLAEIQDYNQRFGTNLQPDNTVLGVNVQPNAFYKEPEKKWYSNPFKVALAVAGLYFGGQALLGSLGSSAAAGTAAGTGATLGTGLTVGAGGTTGLTLGAAGTTGLTAPAGFALAPSLGTSLAAGGAGIGLLDGALTSSMGETGLLADAAGQGLQVPTTPGLSSMGGAQGLTVPVAGGTVTQLGFVPTGATPVLGDPKSFINNPTLLDRPVFTTDSLTMPGDAAPTSNRPRIPNLSGPQIPTPGLLQPPQPSAPARGVDLSTLYNQLNLPVGLLPIAELYRRPSLLG